MACVGRTKQCTIVPPNHFGAIPGVEVGSMWKFRVQVREHLIAKKSEHFLNVVKAFTGIKAAVKPCTEHLCISEVNKY